MLHCATGGGEEEATENGPFPSRTFCQRKNRGRRVVQVEHVHYKSTWEKKKMITHLGSGWFSARMASIDKSHVGIKERVGLTVIKAARSSLVFLERGASVHRGPPCVSSSMLEQV